MSQTVGVGGFTQTKVSRGLLLGVALLIWNIVLVTGAIVLVAGSSGENLGKLVGTIASAIAFIPPAIVVWRVWQRKSAEDANRVAAFHSHINPAEPSAGSPTEPV